VGCLIVDSHGSDQHGSDSHGSGLTSNLPQTRFPLLTLRELDESAYEQRDLITAFWSQARRAASRGR